jgi:hypothetical protein
MSYDEQPDPLQESYQEYAKLEKKLAAKDAELARLRGVEKVLRKARAFVGGLRGSQFASEQQHTEAYAVIHAIDNALAALPSPAEAGEKADDCAVTERATAGKEVLRPVSAEDWPWRRRASNAARPTARTGARSSASSPPAPSDAKAGERPCRCGRPEYPGVIHRADAGCIADPTWKR